MNEGESNANDSLPRHYATKAEQQILIWGLRQYFSYPERSTNRSKIAENVTSFLKGISPHWSHRAVRLWFNNNKKTYFNESQAQVYQMQGQQFLMQPQMQPIYPTQQIPPQTIQTIPLNQIPKSQQNSIFPQQPGMFQQNDKQIKQQSQQLPLAPQPQRNQEKIIEEKIIPPSEVIQEASSQPANKVLLPPIRPPPPKVRFDTPNSHQKPIEVPQKPQTGYQSMSSIVEMIQNINFENDKAVFNKLRDDYDKQASHLISTDGICSADRVDIASPFIRIRTQQEIGDDILADVSSDYQVPSKSLSFMDSTDTLIRPPTPDFYQTRAIWQDRRYTESKIGAYDTVAISNSYAAYAFSDLLSSEKQIAFSNIRDEVTSWKNIPIPTSSQVEALVINDKFAWSTSDHKLIKTYLHGKQTLESSVSASIPKEKAVGIPLISCFNDNSAIIGFTQSKSLFFFENELIEMPSLQYGITSLSSFHNSILCSPCNSFSIRQLSPDGQELRSFVGHCNYIRQIIIRDENTFISRADDNTVRLWDVRAPLPQVQILSATTTVCQNGNYIIIGMSNKGLALIDIREKRAQLCISTQDYNAEAISYNQEKDELSMFGMISRDSIKDSMMFIDNDGQSRKRIFRKYHNFVSIS